MNNRFSVHETSSRSLQQDIREAGMSLLAAASVPVVIKAISLHPITLGFMRLGVASIGLLVILRLFKNEEIKRELLSPLVVLMGLLFGGHWLLYFWGITLSNASISTIGVSTYGFQLYLFGLLLGESKFSLRGFCAILLVLCGLSFVLPELKLESGLFLGFMLTIFSATVHAMLPFLHKRMSYISGELRAFAQFGYGLILFLFLLPWSTWDFGGAELAGLLYLGLFGTLVAHTLWIRVSTSLPSSTAAVLHYIFVPLALIMSNLVLGERLALQSYIGSALIVMASILALYKPALPKEAVAEKVA